jgi:hypothetical protein
MRPAHASDVEQFATATHYSIDVSVIFDGEQRATLAGRERVRYTNHPTFPLNDLDFMLWPNGGSQYLSPVTMSDARANGQPVPPQLGLGQLAARLASPEPLVPGAVVEVTAAFVVQAQAGVSQWSLARFCLTNGVLLAPTFYPHPAHCRRPVANQPGSSGLAPPELEHAISLAGKGKQPGSKNRGSYPARGPHSHCPARLKDTMHFGQQPVQGQHGRRNHAKQQNNVHTFCLQPGVQGIAFDHADILQVGGLYFPGNGFDGRREHVHGHETAAIADELCCRKSEKSGAASHFYDGLAGMNVGSLQNRPRAKEPVSQPALHRSAQCSDQPLSQSGFGKCFSIHFSS